MAYVDEKELNELRSNVDIVDIISNYIPLTSKGKNFFGVCPFHQDHSPSMSVSKEKQMFKCFSCGAAGNVFTFVERYENVSFNEAVSIIANKIGFNLSNNISIKKEVKFPREYEMMDIALKYYQNNINGSSAVDAKKYLFDRGISENNIKEFELGLALNNNSLNKLLFKKNYNYEEMRKLGLISEKQEIYDIFFNRIMFPIHNIEGKVVGFTGRVFDSDGTPKYLGSKESNIYKKSNILFNFHRAKESIKLEKAMVIVEGNMDAIRLYINGIKNVVALMGTALTREHIDIIKKLRCKVILMLDNDNAGEKATYDNALLFEKNNIETFVVRLSGEKDPDDYVLKNGIEAIENNIKKAIPVNEFKLNYLKKDKNLNNTDDLVKYVKVIINDLKNTKDEILREVTLKKISEEYNLSYDVLKRQLEEESVSEIQPQEEIKNTVKQNSYLEAVNNVLYYMMNDSSYIKSYMKKLGYLKEQKYRLIASEIICYYEMNNTINIADFITYINTSKLKEDIMDIIKISNIDELNEKIFMDSINLIKRKNIDEEIRNLKKQLKNSLDENEKEKIAQKIMDLKVGSVDYERN